MATSSILGADRASTHAAGRDVESLGPSDTSDSGSDVQGELDLASPTNLDDTIFGTVQPGIDSDSDSGGTGERGAALPDEEAVEGSDIMPDQVQSFGQQEQSLDEETIEAELDAIELAETEPVPQARDSEDESDEGDEGADSGRS